MGKIKNLLITLEKQEHSGILVLALLLLALHLATIMQPPSPVFDEQYYVPSALSILQGTGTDRTEHPPLGQLLIASGIKCFGDNPFGWRFFSILFGIAGVVIFYFICRQLRLSGKYAFLPAFLLSFENLSFVQSSIAMLDVFSLTFMLASFWLYLKGKYKLAGVMVGLATLAKLTGILALPIIILHWLLTSRKQLKSLAAGIIVTLATILLLMPLFDFVIWHKWLSPLSQITTMLNITSGSTFAKYPSEMLSRPWDWIIRPEILTYWIDPHYLAIISPTIWALIIPATAFIFYKSIKGNAAALFALVWLAGTGLIWIPANLITDRMTYIYYFYPATGAVCIAISLVFSALENLSSRTGRNSFIEKSIGSLLPIYLLLCLGAFVILSPVSYWWKSPLCIAAYLASRYYSKLPSMEVQPFGDNAALNGKVC